VPTPHLKAGLLAALLVAAALIGMRQYAAVLQQRYIHALAPLELDQKNVGSSLQRAAFAQPDLLPIYGSSELYVEKSFQRPYRASVLLANEPTGFDVFPVGQGNTTSIIFAQNLAAIGPELAGKKVVISLSPSWFFRRVMVEPYEYDYNFSHMHADALAFSTDLSFELKRDLARRMLDYPETLASDPLLRFAVTRLADGSFSSQLLYDAALPLGKLQNAILDLQDAWEVIHYIRSQPRLSANVARQAANLNWPDLLQRAEQQHAKHSGSNPFGFNNDDWYHGISNRLRHERNTWNDQRFLQIVQSGTEWEDLDLLLRELHELRAQPMIVALPISGKFYDALGVSPGARSMYYQKLRQVVARYNVPVRTFADHDEDRNFLLDDSNHLSGKGWVYVDRLLDDFYHNRVGTSLAEP
jgi:D-alanine transfer protein